MLFVAGVEGYLSGGSDANQGSLLYKLKSVTNIASLATYLLWLVTPLAFSSLDTRVHFLVRLLLEVLKYLKKKCYLYIDISKWLDIRVFSDKDVKIVGSSDPVWMDLSPYN